MSQKDNLIIYGNGSMARMMAEYVKSDYNLVAFTVDKQCIEDSELNGLPVIPFDEVTQHYPPENHLMLTAVGFVEMNEVRRRKHLEAKEMGYAFINYVHPTASVCDSTIIGENNVILEFVALNPNVTIGNGNFICGNCNIGHDCVISNYCWINGGVSIAGNTKIKDNCFLGVNSCVSNDFVLEKSCFIGGGVLVSQKTTEGEVLLAPGAEKHRLNSEEFLKFFVSL